MSFAIIEKVVPPLRRRLVSNFASIDLKAQQHAAENGQEPAPGKDELAFAAIMVEALMEGLGPTHQAVKIALRWTGAGERSVKHWLAGTHAPRAIHLL